MDIMVPEWSQFFGEDLGMYGLFSESVVEYTQKRPYRAPGRRFSSPGYRAILFEKWDQKWDQKENPLIISGFLWCWEL